MVELGVSFSLMLASVMELGTIQTETDIWQLRHTTKFEQSLDFRVRFTIDSSAWLLIFFPF